jgi:hypothetical protein
MDPVGVAVLLFSLGLIAAAAVLPAIQKRRNRP